MAGEGLIPPDFVGLEFWSGFPRKFNSKKDYQVSKEKETKLMKRTSTATPSLDLNKVKSEKKITNNNISY